MSASWDQQTDRNTQKRSAAGRLLPQQARREVVEAALFLFLSLAVFFWPAVFSGRVLLPTDLIFEIDPLWRPLAPEGYTHPANQILSDQVYAFFPWKILTVRSLAQGHLPLWNPYINGGQPFVGNAQSAIFSPFNLLSYFLPFYPSYVVTAILRLFVAGIFTFLFAREIGLNKPGALLAMMVFTFSGPMIVWLGYPLSPVIAWLPAMLLTVERVLTRKSGLYVVACGLVVGVQFLGGHPETSFLVMLAWTAYALYRAVVLEGWQLSALFSQLLRIAAAATIGLLLAAVQLLPFVEALLQSAIMSARQAEAAGGTSSFLVRLLLEWRNWPTAITVLLPQYFGTPLDNSYLYPYSNYVEQNAYAGVLPLALAAAIILYGVKHHSSSRRGLVLFFALLAGVCLGIAIRLPVVNGINYLPLFNISANGRMRLIYAFAVAILAGMGLDEVSAGRQESLRLTLRILVLLALISLALIVFAYIGFVVFKDEIIQFGRAFVESSWGTPYFSRPLEHYYALVDERYEKKLALFLPKNIVMYLPVFVALACLALHRWGQKLWPGSKMWTYVALGLTMLDVFLIGMPFNPTIASQDVFPPPGAIQFLQQDPDVYRVSGTGMILYPNSNMVFGVSDMRGYDAVVPRRYVDLVDRMEGRFRLRHYSLLVGAGSPLLDLLNVKYILTDQELSGRWEWVYRDASGVNVYRNRDVLPRAFIVYRAQVVDSAAQSLSRITDSVFDFRERVVLEEMPPDWREPSEIPSTPAATRIVDYEPNRVRVEVETAVDGLLVLTDTYMPGWKALVDGRSTGVHVADHAFRAVVVPAGIHQVEFVYKPLSFQIGAVVSLATLVFLIVAFLLSRVRHTGDSGL